MARRCLNDLFGYCTGSSTHTPTGVVLSTKDALGRPLSTYQEVKTCQLDPKTCELHQTATEHYQPLIQRVADGYPLPGTRKQNSHESRPPD